MIDASRNPNEAAAAPSRRDLFKGGGAAVCALGVGDRADAGPARRWPRINLDRQAVILVNMVGGASPWETFDPQPDAPDRHRGPFGSIATAVPGVRVTEHLPEVARRLGRLALIRSIHHDADPTHDAGLRLLTTGHPTEGRPTLGAIAAEQLGVRGGMPPYVVLPNLVAGVERPSARWVVAPEGRPELAPFVGGAAEGSARFDPRHLRDRARRWVDRATAQGLTWSGESGHDAGGGGRNRDWDWEAEPDQTRARFGASPFGRDCWLAGQMVAAGARLVVINMATRLFGPTTWDAHGRTPFGTFDDYSGTLLPAFDRGFTGLVDSLRSRGLLDSTLVVASGEFGRTPWINESGGRDHWPGVWSALVAGGGTLGGQVLGASDRDGRPRDRPVHVAELVATLGFVLGLDRPAGPSGTDSLGAAPILELFA